jgi:hypothetical protein
MVEPSPRRGYHLPTERNMSTRSAAAAATAPRRSKRQASPPPMAYPPPRPPVKKRRRAAKAKGNRVRFQSNIASSPDESSRGTPSPTAYAKAAREVMSGLESDTSSDVEDVTPVPKDAPPVGLPKTPQRYKINISSPVDWDLHQVPVSFQLWAGKASLRNNSSNKFGANNRFSIKDLLASIQSFDELRDKIQEQIDIKNWDIAEDKDHFEIYTRSVPMRRLLNLESVDGTPMVNLQDL